MLGYYKCLGEKWNIGNQQFCKKSAPKKADFSECWGWVSKHTPYEKVHLPWNQSFPSFSHYLFIPVILDAKTIERISVSTQIPRRSQFDGEKRQLLITFLVHQHFHFSSEPLGCHFLSLLLRFAATINPCRELFSWSTLFDKDAIVQFTGLPPLQRQSN